MRNVLLTGFDVFGEYTANASWDSVLELDGWRTERLQIVGTMLPCEFGVAAEKLELAIQQTRPVLVICVGMAAGTTGITLERLAVNLVDASLPDNVGNQPQDQCVVQDGPAAYFSGLPVRCIQEALIEQGIPAALSCSAGTYVCNHVFYHLMHSIALYRPSLCGGFVHVPPTTDMHVTPGTPVLPVGVIIRALKSIVNTALDNMDETFLRD